MTVTFRESVRFSDLESRLDTETEEWLLEKSKESPAELNSAWESLDLVRRELPRYAFVSHALSFGSFGLEITDSFSTTSRKNLAHSRSYYTKHIRQDWLQLRTVESFDSEFERNFLKALWKEIHLTNVLRIENQQQYHLIVDLDITDALQASSKDIKLTTENVADLRRYLAEFKSIQDAISSTVKRANELFEPNAEIELSYYTDPEIDDEYPILTIRTNDYSKRFMRTLSELQAFSCRILDKSDGWLLVTTDFAKL